MAFWRQQMHAVDLLASVSAVLRASELSGRPMPHYERAEAAWCRGIFAPDSQWNQPIGSSVGVLEESAVDMLHGLADLIDATDSGDVIDAAGQRAVGDALDDVMVLLADEALSLSPVEKRYVFELIMSIRGVLDEAQAFGSVELLRRVHELFGYLTRLSEDLSDHPETADLAQRIKDVARRVLPYVRFSTGFAVGALSVVADIQQITS